MSHILGRISRMLATASFLAGASIVPLAAQADSWTAVRSVVAIRGLATDGSTYVGAASNGIWTSTDLKSWTRASLPASAGVLYNDVLWDGHRFIAVGLGVISSTDGSSWSTDSAPDGIHVWNAITVNGGSYVVVGGNVNGDGVDEILRSTDGTSWRLRNLPAASRSALGITDGDLYLTGAASDGSQFIAKGEISSASGGVRDFVMTSPDGLNWTSGALAANTGYMFGGLNGAAWGNGSFVAGSEAGVYTSPDGVTWSPHELGNASQPNGSFWLFDHLRFLNGGFVAAGFDASESTDREDIALFSSPDGLTWHSSRLAARGASSFSMSDVTFSHGKYVAAGYQGVYTSPDAANWTRTFIGPQTNLTSCVIAGDGIFTAPGIDGSITSSDGSSWNSKLSGTQGPTVTGKGCGIFVKGEFVIASGGKPLWSSDGKTWNVAGGITGVIAVASDGKQFLGLEAASGLDAEVFVSPDGKNWTTQAITGLPLHTIKFGADGLTGGGLTYEGGRYVAWGRDIDQGEPVIFTSTDGSKWTQATISGLPAGAGIGAVAFGNGSYAGVGEDGDDSYVLSSTDGSAWKAKRIGTSPRTWYSIVWGNDEFMAVGQAMDTGRGVALRIDGGTSTTSETVLDVPVLWDVDLDGEEYVAVSGYDFVRLKVGSSSGGGGSGGGGGGTSGGGGGGGDFSLLCLGLLAGFERLRRR